QLSGVLHNGLAEEISVKIIRAFVAMRRFITANAYLFQRVDAIEHRQMLTEQKMHCAHSLQQADGIGLCKA
ncbi:MAG: hypothetical protein IJT61_00285, partial [Bacteroidales bacterium]|nr:hypothetical protein [Bacteroidales bacterium]